MAGINQKTSTPSSRNNFEVRYSGKWAIGASGAVGTKTGGTGMTLARTATGLYTLTLDATPAAIVDVTARVVSNTSVICTLTHETKGATFRTGVYASPQTAADMTTGFITIEVTALKSLVK